VGELEVVAPQLRKPSVVINNVPIDMTVGNLEEVIIAQNPELELVQGDMKAKFMYSTKRGQNKIVVEVGPETRKKLHQKKLKNCVADLRRIGLPSSNEVFQI
jgi:hypothetical protein